MNNEEQNTSHDRLAKLNPFLILLKVRFKSVYMPGSVITIDETMVPCEVDFPSGSMLQENSTNRSLKSTKQQTQTDILGILKFIHGNRIQRLVLDILKQSPCSYWKTFSDAVELLSLTIFSRVFASRNDC